MTGKQGAENVLSPVRPSTDVLQLHDLTTNGEEERTQATGPSPEP